MLDVEGISYRYPESEPVLKGVSFAVGEGEKVVLLGANGCGKTTLLRVLNGLIFPQEGCFRYEGEEVTARRSRDKSWNRRFRKEVVLLFQHPEAMLFNPTVYDEIAYSLRQIEAEGLDERVQHWAAQLGVERHLRRPPFQLSGGEKQRVCLAALLALEPKLLLLDEPTANLDPRSTGWLIDFLQDLPVTSIATTHNLGLAAELGSRTLVLSEGHELIFDGGLEELMADEEKLLAANLVHAHRHPHGGSQHRHFHVHDWS
jgi:cobalt/nickel transport system ATP-binding protein